MNEVPDSGGSMKFDMGDDTSDKGTADNAAAAVLAWVFIALAAAIVVGAMLWLAEIIWRAVL